MNLTLQRTIAALLLAIVVLLAGILWTMRTQARESRRHHLEMEYR